MENSNRNDIQEFFKDMPEHLQKEAINKIKKPPDTDSKKKESEVVQNLATMR